MKESPFGKIVDLLTVVNDLDKRGYEGQITPALIESLVVEAVSRYNMDFSVKKPINQSMPANQQNQHAQPNKQVQATPAPVEPAEKPKPAPKPAPRQQREE